MEKKQIEKAKSAAGLVSKATSVVQNAFEITSHLDSGSRWLSGIFGLSPKTDDGGKKHNQDEIHYIRMLMADGEDGLSEEERHKLASFLLWCYRVKPERHFVIRMYLLWLQSHRKNDWRDILAFASSPAKDGSDVTVITEPGDKKGAGKKRTISEPVPGKSGMEAQKLLREGIALIDHDEHIEGFEKARAYWISVGLPVMPNKEMIDALERSIIYIPRWVKVNATRKARLAAKLVKKHGPVVIGEIDDVLVSTGQKAVDRIKTNPERRAARKGLARLLK